jgi:hypothetical protein
MKIVGHIEFIHTLETGLAIVLRSFGLLARKDFQIIWLSNLLILSVPD